MDSINIPDFSFASPLAESVVRLERLRTQLKISQGSESPLLDELRRLFGHLSSVLSARIEGNRTTIVDALTATSAGNPTADDGIQEILNLEAASQFIDENVGEDFIFTEHFIRTLHTIAVDGLRREGDKTPGGYRTTHVGISQSAHTPPGPESVSADMHELVDFINPQTLPQNQLLQTAIAHHRFVWIHPFTNGNGRVARLLTYAMLIKQGFTSVSGYRALNPTIVFGADRNLYYEKLSEADSLNDQGIIQWCLYVLQGVERDIEHIIHLSDESKVLNDIYAPALERAYKADHITNSQIAVLLRVAELGVAKSGDVADLIPGSSATRSQFLKKLVSQNLLIREEGTRKYQVCLSNLIAIYVVRQLDNLGMLPEILKD